MSCRETKLLLDQARNVPLSHEQRDALAQHLATCPACRQHQAELTQATTAVRQDAATVTVPDIDQEIRAVQGRLSAPPLPRKRTLAPVLWLGAPLAAAAAVMLAWIGGGHISPTAQETTVTHVDYVVTGNPAASTMVYVDQDSGWLVVWASAPAEDHNG